MKDPTSETRHTDRWVLDHLPGAVMVIDDSGLITAASERAAALVGRPLLEFVGSSILTYVDPDAVWAYAAALNTAIDSNFVDTYGGPVRIAVHGVDGVPIAADLWSSNQSQADGPRGLVLLLTEQTVSQGIADAVGFASTNAPISDVAASIVTAVGGFPLIADAAIYLENADGRHELAASNVAASLVNGSVGDELWTSAVQRRSRVLYNAPSDAAAPLDELLVAAGYEALWIEPIVLGDDVPCGALVAFRRLPGEPTSNELANLHQAASVMALAVCSRRA